MNEHFIQDDIKYRHKDGNSGYYTVQTILYYKLLYNNFKIKIYKTIILPVMVMKHDLLH